MQIFGSMYFSDGAIIALCWDFPGGSDGKQSACNEGDPGSIPGLGRSTGEGNNKPLQYSYLENSMDRGSWKVGYRPWGSQRVEHN